MTSRTKLFLWIALSVLLLAGIGLGAYYFLAPGQSKTSLFDVVTPPPPSTPTPPAPAPPAPESPQPSAPVSNPAPIPPAPTDPPTPGPVPTPTPKPKVDQPISAEPSPNLHPVISVRQPALDAKVGSTLSSGQQLPKESPDTGAATLLLSGLAGVAAAGGAYKLRKLKKSRKS